MKVLSKCNLPAQNWWMYASFNTWLCVYVLFPSGAFQTHHHNTHCGRKLVKNGISPPVPLSLRLTTQLRHLNNYTTSLSLNKGSVYSFTNILLYIMVYKR